MCSPSMTDGKRLFNQKFQELRKRRQQVRHGSTVAEGLADVGIAVHIAWSEDKTSAELKGIFTQLVLAMSGGAGAFARDLVVFAQQVKQVGVAQVGGFEGLALLVYQKRELDAGLFTK